MIKFGRPILVTQSTLPDFEEYKEKIRGIWENHWLTNQGVLHQELQKKLEEYFDVKHVTLCVNGHSALDVMIKGMGLKGEVITTPFTFVSTIHALSMNGIKPIFCDIKETDYTIDENKIEQLITPETTAILGVHVYGYACNIDKLVAISKKYNLKLIFDAAHAFGVEYKEKPLVAYGDASMLSFHATKVFNSIEGGAIAYNEDKMTKKFDLIKNFGIADAEHITTFGINAKMNEFQAAMGLCNLEHIKDSINKRRKIVELYNRKLSCVHGINLAHVSEKVTKYNYAYYPIVINAEEYGLDRDELCEKLMEFNVYPRKYFYPLISECECYKNIQHKDDLKVAKRISSEVLTLPLYSELSLLDAEKICNIISGFGKK